MAIGCCDASAAVDFMALVDMLVLKGFCQTLLTADNVKGMNPGRPLELARQFLDAFWSVYGAFVILGSLLTLALDGFHFQSVGRAVGCKAAVSWGRAGSNWLPPPPPTGRLDPPMPSGWVMGD